MGNGSVGSNSVIRMTQNGHATQGPWPGGRGPHVDSRPVSGARTLSVALRREAWLLVAAAVAGAALFGTASALQPKTYESRAEVTVSPVSLEQRFGAPDAPTTPEAAIARELRHARSDAVLGRADSQIEFEHGLTVEQVSDDTIAFVGTSTNGPFAESVANTAATTYVTVRQEVATGLADSAIGFTQGIVDDLTARAAAGEDVAADLAAQQELLAGYQAGRDAVAETAQVTLEPTSADDAVAPRPWAAAAAGLFVGLVAGLVIAAVHEFARAGTAGADGPGSAIAAAMPSVQLRRRDGGPLRAGWLHERRTALVILTGLVIGRAAVYVALGVNFILDDWSLAALRESEGRWQAVPTGQDLVNARPGAWLTFTLLHGIVGPHPLVQFLVLTAVNVAVVLVLYLVLARFFDRAVALAVTAVWVLLPIHQSMTVWSGTSQIAVGALALLLGVLAYTHGRWLLAGLAMSASILCYELSVPLAFAAAVLVATPLAPLVPAPSRPLTWRSRLGVLAMLAVTTWWSRTHAVYPVELEMPSPATLWSGHFGMGLFGSLEAPDPLVAAAGAVTAALAAVCLVWWVRGERGRGDGPSLVLAGVGVFGLGLYVSVTVATGVLGFNDRLYSLSSIGAAMMLVGIGMFLWRRVPVTTLVLGALLVAAATVGQFVSLRSWSQAGADTVALLRYLETTYPDPANTDFIVGPTPVFRNNVVGITSPYGGADPAFDLRFPGGEGSLVVANSREEFVPVEGTESLVDWSRVLGADTSD